MTHAQQVNGWQSSIDNLFFVFTERGQNLCIDSSQAQCASNTFCAYHSAFGNNTVYAALPYAASFNCNPGSSPNGNDADQTINVSSHEVASKLVTTANHLSGTCESSHDHPPTGCATR